MERLTTTTTDMDVRRRRRSSISSAFQSITAAAVAVERKIERLLTIHYDDLPHWLRDNPSIQTGYRPPSSSFTASLSSIMHLHNETVNIWTHLLGSVLFLILAVTLYSNVASRYPTATVADISAFSAFFAGATGCLGMSAAYHTISNHSEGVAGWGNRADYVGIIGLIVGSFVASCYYGFLCEPFLQHIYWTMVRLLWFSATSDSQSTDADGADDVLDGRFVVWAWDARLSV